MLPHWLVPYHHYTACSMLYALLLAAATRTDGINSLFAVAEKLLDPDSRVNGSLLDRWLDVCLAGFHRAHAELRCWANLSQIATAPGAGTRLDELVAYCRALGIRGPPFCQDVSVLHLLLQHHARTCGRFLFGTPSQQR